MSISSTANIGFGIIIKGDDSDALEKIMEFCEGTDVDTIEDSLDSDLLLVDATGSLLFGGEGNDIVLVVADTYRNFDITSSDFAGVFRIGEDGVSDDGIEELRKFCENIGLETTASWLAWNSAS